ETAATLGDRGQHRQQDRPEQRVVLARAHPGMGTCEDRRRGLAPKVVDRVARVGEATQGRRLLVDETADERPVLVERRPAAACRMLFEGEGKLRAALDGERRETEGAQRLIEVRSTQRHGVSYAPAGRSPTSPYTPRGWASPRRPSSSPPSSSLPAQERRYSSTPSETRSGIRRPGRARSFSSSRSRSRSTSCRSDACAAPAARADARRLNPA